MSISIFSGYILMSVCSQVTSSCLYILGQHLDVCIYILRLHLNDVLYVLRLHLDVCMFSGNILMSVYSRATS